MPPSTKIDPSILSALALDPKDVKISPHGSSGFTSSFRLTTPTTSIFVKTSSTSDAATMFEGEHTSLNAIHSTVPSLAPKSFAWGKLSDTSGYFLATEFLDMGSRSSSSSTGSGLSLASKLATLHSTPPPSEHKDKGFGFPVPTCCGSTIQNNTWKPTWSTFFAENRLLHILKQAEANHGPDKQLRSLIEQTVETVVPRLLADGHLGGSTPVTPVLTHGDLWSGNKSRASFTGRPEGENGTEAVIFDPSSAYTHNEYDHGIMNMFGGFDRAFWKEYFEKVPKTEPEGEYEDRVRLYECYHQLNHYVMFGGGYKGSAVGILRGLIKMYGGGDGKG